MTNNETGAFVMVPAERANELGPAPASMFIPLDTNDGFPLVEQALEGLWALRRRWKDEQRTLAEFKAALAEWELVRIASIPAFPLLERTCGAYLLLEPIG